MVMVLLTVLATTFLMTLVVIGRALQNIQTDKLPAETLHQNSVTARYRPLLWLLDEADYQLTAAIFPGESQLRRIRSGRRASFRLYLRNLGADHTRIVGAIREILVQSPRDLPDLAKALYRSQLTFFLAMMLIEVKLQLHALGVGTVNARSLVAAVASLQLKLDDLVFIQAVTPY